MQMRHRKPSLFGGAKPPFRLAALLARPASLAFSKFRKHVPYLADYPLLVVHTVHETALPLVELCRNSSTALRRAALF